VAIQAFVERPRFPWIAASPFGLLAMMATAPCKRDMLSSAYKGKNLLRKIENRDRLIPMTHPVLGMRSERARPLGRLTPGKGARKFLPRKSSVTH
jgi:hypothetical protein